MMSGLIHAFDYLESNETVRQAFIVAKGDDAFLKQLVVSRLESTTVPDDGLTKLSGHLAAWYDVVDELSTLSLFGSGPRAVLIDEADEFVTKFRAQVEDYCAQPLSSGILILDVRSLPTNTRLYKSAAAHATIIDCGVPQFKRGKSNAVDHGRVKKWLQKRARDVHALRLNQKAIELIVDLVGLELGLIDQEIKKLALFVEPNQSVELDLVNQVIGGWRQKTTWEMIDAAANGNAAEALRELDRLLQTGEHPNALFGSLSWSLRRFAAVSRIVQRQAEHGRRVDLPAAALEAGFRKWPQEAFDRALKQLKQLGRDRAEKMYDWLLETDLSLKGSHSAPDKARFAIEKLIFQMAKRNQQTT